MKTLIYKYIVCLAHSVKVRGWTVFFKNVSWEIMTQLNFNVSHHDNNEKIVPSKRFEKIAEVEIMKYLRCVVEKIHFSHSQNALLLEIFVIRTQPHTQLGQF